MDFAIQITGNDGIGQMTFNKAANYMNNVYLSLVVNRGSFFQNRALGSRLYLLRRSKLTPQTAALAADYVKEALQWMIDAGRATAVDVQTEIDTAVTGRLKVRVDVTQNDGSIITFTTFVGLLHTTPAAVTKIVSSAAPLLYPAVYPTPGLPQAVFDALGTAMLETPICGAADNALYTVAADYTITIPAPVGGGMVSWVRGVWKATTQFRYYSLMADVKPGDPNPQNLVAAGNFAVNQTGETIITLDSSLATVGEQVQVFYSHKSGATASRGEALGGWPFLHSANALNDYGDAVDGDNYIMQSLYYLYQATGTQAAKALADGIAAALAQYEAMDPNTISFDKGVDAEQDSGGLYNYFGGGATFEWSVVQDPGTTTGKCLRVQADIPSGGYAGWGAWPTRTISAQNPINAIDVDIWGDGSGRAILITSNIDPGNAASGDVAAAYPMLAADAGKWRTVGLTLADFWKLANVAYNGDRQPWAYNGVYGGAGVTENLSTGTPDNTAPEGWAQFLAQQFNWDWTNAASGQQYAGCYFGISSGVSSAGTTGLYFDLIASAADTFTITVIDANNNKFTATINVTAAWQTFDIPWAYFTPVTAGTALTHPVNELKIDIGALASGWLQINTVRFGAIENAVGSTVLNGLQLAFATDGNYNVYFNNLMIDQPVTDPYAGLPRWDYSWPILANGQYGEGSWRGPSAPGYLWLGGWQQSNPAMAAKITGFMRDAQNAYAAKFPAATPGPFMPRYGRWSWEAIADNELNQWYFEGDEWYGYEYRALLSCAYYYYLTGDATAKAVLDEWMGWINAKIITVSGHYAAPDSFNADGTGGYTMNGPCYAHACIAAACIYKYWRDGDAVAKGWYRALLDDLHNNYKITNPAPGAGSLYGAYDSEPTAWEQAEIANAFGMLLNGRPGGVVNYPLPVGPNDAQDFLDLWNFFLVNASDTRPSMMSAKWVPLHEWHWSSWHPALNAEGAPVNPVTQDTHADGMCWTEDIGPCLTFAVDVYKYTGDSKWLQILWTLVNNMLGVAKPATATAQTGGVVLTTETGETITTEGGADINV